MPICRFSITSFFVRKKAGDVSGLLEGRRVLTVIPRGVLVKISVTSSCPLAVLVGLG